jgi:ABC-type Fe3+-siderophore transport system permease subunit
MQNLVDRLEKKGWGRKDIIKAVEAIKNAKKGRARDIIFIEKRIFWILIILIIAANFAVSVALLPLLVALRGALPYFVIATLGSVFGLLFELVIRSMEHLERQHHLFLAILIPLVAVANMFIISSMSGNLARVLNLSNANNPAIISIIYAASFVLPYVVCRFVLKIGYYAKG